MPARYDERLAEWTAKLAELKEQGEVRLAGQAVPIRCVPLGSHLALSASGKWDERTEAQAADDDAWKLALMDAALAVGGWIEYDQPDDGSAPTVLFCYPDPDAPEMNWEDVRQHGEPVLTEDTALQVANPRALHNALCGAPSVALLEAEADEDAEGEPAEF